jgi:hypothetical protein
MGQSTWMVYMVAVLVVSGGVGLHLGRFRAAYTEMTGMMAGMTMGMLNGFLLGYGAAAATGNLFWGNLAGILMGLALGAYFGRAGGLLGVMDGSLGGVMGGAMGAMLAVMLLFPREALVWTAVLLGIIYVASMIGLVLLIERSAPEHAALHRLMPMFARAVSVEAAEEAEERGYSSRAGRESKGAASPGRRLIDYYGLLGVDTEASEDEIEQAYFQKRKRADQATLQRLERALFVLTDAQRREVYDRRLGSSKAGVSATAGTQSGDSKLTSKPTKVDA